MIKIRIRSFWTAILVLLSSCVGGERDGVVCSAQAAEVAVSFSIAAGQTPLGDPLLQISDGPVSYSIVDPGTQTDEATAPGYIPQDIWVIQYNGTTDQAPLVGKPRYVVFSGPTNIQAVASTMDNTLIFVANTHSPNIDWGDISTLGRIKQACRVILKESDCYGSNLSTAKDLILSGRWEGVIDNRAISAELFRNITRLDLTINNGSASGMTLRTIELCNVPRDYYYMGGLVARDEIFPKVLNYFNYPVEPITTAMNPGSQQHFTFYMPANQRGVNLASTSSSAKSENAPSYATYFRIVALDAQNRAFVYQIYPGANMVDDYNLMANHRYGVELTINAPGDASSDGRVENFDMVDFEDSNSFILNPSPEGTPDRVFTFPITRVNDFWMMMDPTLTISQGEAWTAELIWQDVPTTDLIRFIDPLTEIESTTMRGVGPSERICLTTKSTYQGNALIGLKKVGRESLGYLWSWHLWVTPYDPQYNAVATRGQYIYSVTGGELHRYQGDMWTPLTGRYHDSYVMDRNLGSRVQKGNHSGAMYYQFGRKDPFPSSNVPIYDINGMPIPTSDPRNAAAMNIDAGPGVTLATGVLNPTYFYYRVIVNGKGDWTNQGKILPYMWNNLAPDVNQKSIFDPCPHGWEVPMKEVWSDYFNKFDNPSISTVLNPDRSLKLAWVYQGINGLRYWPVGQEIAGSIYHPAYGYRLAWSGAVSAVGSGFFCWTQSPVDHVNATSLGSYSNIVYNGLGYDRSYGFGVRCVRR